MPLTALCTNISWEFLAAFILPAPCRQFQQASGLWLFADLCILATAILYGAADFRHHLATRKKLLVILVLGLLVSGHIQFELIVTLDDPHGIVVAQINNFLLSALLIVMACRRWSLQGQSLVIAAALLAVNLLCWFAYERGGCLELIEYPDHNRFMHILFVYIICLNVAYVALLGYFSYAKLSTVGTLLR
ncbi:hypothetical protein N8766_05985 [bacterium]|nr:hypothetical protein [bacterium]MDB4798651.1 hypothetical protein [Verrucomicrobiota bacterium]